MDICRQREGEERNARAAVLLAQQNRAATVKAADLDLRIAAAEVALNAVDKKEAVKEADPQSASMANAIGADRNLIAALSQAFFAIAIEFGSGVGFWLVFGHAGPGRRVEVDSPSQSTLVPVGPPQTLIPIDEKPADIVERFFLEVVHPVLNRRVRSLVMGGLSTVACRSQHRYRHLPRHVREVGAPAEGPDWRSRLVSGLRACRRLWGA